MKFSILLTVFAASLPAYAKTLVTRDLYLENIAFPQLAHIAEFRANLTAAGTLTPAQDQALNLITDVVAQFATDKLDAAEQACIAAFSKEICYGIITANGLRGQHGSGGGAGAVAARADNWCGCATLSDYCKGSKSCKLRKNSCWYQSYGCGFLLAVPCDGICG